MYFVESIEQALEYSVNALNLMKLHKIPVNPANYTVWYVYQSGTNADLKRDVDEHRKSGVPFNDDRNNALYDRYFGNNAQTTALQDTGRRIEAAVERLQGYLGEAGQSTSRYGESLVAYSGKLDQSAGADDVRAVIAGILSETTKMAEQHKKLESQISESTQEIAELRRNVQSIRKESLTDSLTGIANRKSFDDTLGRAVAQAMKSGEDLCLLMLDIDHFKKFNDTYGHQIGDGVLKLVAQTFTECVKGRDLAARYGGEEFGIILPQTVLANAVTLADQIRATVESKKIINRNTGESMGKITLSAGVAKFRAGESIESLIRRADEALYAAKHQGRNRVVSEERMDSTIAVAS